VVGERGEVDDRLAGAAPAARRKHLLVTRAYAFDRDEMARVAVRRARQRQVLERDPPHHRGAVQAVGIVDGVEPAAVPVLAHDVSRSVVPALVIPHGSVVSPPVQPGLRRPFRGCPPPCRVGLLVAARGSTY